MISIEQLFASKNKTLQHFLQISLDFLKNLEEEHWEKTDIFMARRQNLLQAMGVFDRKIEEKLAQMSDDEKNDALRQAAQRHVSEKDDLVYKIRDLDAKILKFIDDERLRVRQEMVRSRKQQEILGKFKSSSSRRGQQSGESIDRKL